MDIGCGAAKSDEKSVNVVRDTVFGGDEEKYRMAEGIATGIAGAGTAAINSLGLGEKVLNAACFAEGTLVLTSVGLVCIEALCVGDKVYAKDTETGETSWQTVEQVFERDTDVLTVVTINGEMITTTPEHPFYVKGEGWIDARDLKEGMEAELADGGSGIVEAVEVQYLDEPVTVYNMEVAESHTYYVAEAGVLVHNSPGCVSGANGSGVTPGSGGTEVVGSEIKYSPSNPGPLSPQDANSFNGATYTEKVLTEDTTFYRVYGGNAEQVGQYMSRTPQNGGLQSQIDLALNPEWRNTAQNVTKVTVPAGTTIYEGTAAPQIINGGTGELLGGGNQVFIPWEELNSSWFGN